MTDHDAAPPEAWPVIARWETVRVDVCDRARPIHYAGGGSWFLPRVIEVEFRPDRPLVVRVFAEYDDHVPAAVFVRDDDTVWPWWLLYEALHVAPSPSFRRPDEGTGQATESGG